jgi:hypothetical protein
MLGVVALLAGAVPAAAGDDDPSEVGLEVYLWGASLGGNTAAGDDISVPFTDLLKDLELGFMSSFGARKGRWVLLGDVLYLSVGDDVETTGNIIGNPITLSADLELKGWVVTLGGGYRAVKTDTATLDVLAGARYLDLNTKLRFSVNDTVFPFGAGSHFWDAIVGVRGKASLGEKWYLSYYFDVGTGNTDLTWQALGAVNYRFKKLDLRIGYRYLRWDFGDDDPGGEVFDDITFHGPYAGVVFTF